MFRFLIFVIALAIGLPLLVRWAWSEGLIPAMPSFLYVSTGIVAFITTVIALYLYRLNKPSLFVQFYLLSLVVKLLAALAYCLLMVLKDRAGSTANVIYFLVLYVLFTSLEIVFLYKKITVSRRR